MKFAQTRNKPIQDSRDELIQIYKSTRRGTTDICAPLEIEDYVTQPISEVSPPKWHLGHTTWFFEELLLVAFLPGYVRYNDGYRLLFNSYYKSAGKHWIQGERGNLSRPTVAEVLAYRDHVDEKLIKLIESGSNNPEIGSLIEIGLHHEQQHQELLFMDIKSILGANPLHPEYVNAPLIRASAVTDKWQSIDEGIYEVGYQGRGFAYDNEVPTHKTYLESFKLCECSVTNREYLEFMQDGGYSSPGLWLSLGWDWVVENNVKCPLYWQQIDNEWHEFTLHGQGPLDGNTPVTHISYFEADAYARWKGLRLPTEQELEVYLKQSADENIESRSNMFHPVRADVSVGQVWYWSRSHYSPYPRYQAYQGVLEEYNGKFMCNQFVLKGGCAVTPAGHYRHTYRNFYQPHQRWMFSGIRLARDVS